MPRNKKQDSLSLEQRERIRKLRREEGLSHDALAERFGVPKGTINYVLCSEEKI